MDNSKTLRELLVDGDLVNVAGAPSYIHNWDVQDDDDTVTFSWDDEGETFEEEYPLDEPPPNTVLVVRIIPLHSHL